MTRLLTPLSGEDKYVIIEWFRALPGGIFNEIKDVKVG